MGCDTEVGYLHRGFEKMCEQGTWTQCIPYTDRLNYASPFINNFIFTEAVERMLGITVPEEYGGAGLKWIDLVVLLEEAGRALYPSPLTSSALAVAALCELGE